VKEATTRERARAPTYRWHRPERTTLFAVVSEHDPRFLETIESSGGNLPGLVRQQFGDYLKCGLLEHCFLRLKCDGCWRPET
jgi:hypothetical protein